jgi:hypothetical protein
MDHATNMQPPSRLLRTRLIIFRFHVCCSQIAGSRAREGPRGGGAEVQPPLPGEGPGEEGGGAPAIGTQRKGASTAGATAHARRARRSLRLHDHAQRHRGRNSFCHTRPPLAGYFTAGLQSGCLSMPRHHRCCQRSFVCITATSYIITVLASVLNSVGSSPHAATCLRDAAVPLGTRMQRRPP